MIETINKEIICPNCGETSEPGWAVCWNCQWELTLPDNDKTNLLIRKKQEAKEEGKYVKLSSQHIIAAGKQIKGAVKLTIVSFIVALISLILAEMSNSTKIYLVSAICLAVIYVLILVNLFQAGNDLIKSVPEQKDID